MGAESQQGLKDALASDMDAQCCHGLPAELIAKRKKSYFELASVSLMDIAVVNQFRFMDTRSSKDVGLMAYGGNNHADVFFNQDGWTDVGKIEAKYTSRVVELYKQLL
ncbi:probable ADP-ribosylation factor GTPase-activating protein AGD8 [Tanacetum coccineum]